MIQFVWPWLLILLPAPLLARRWLPPARAGSGEALRVPFFHTLERLSGGRKRGAVRNPRLLLASLAWSLLLVATAQPLWVGDFQDKPTTGRDLMLLVDISGSMRERDFVLERESIDRLSMVKQLAGRFIDRREGDRLGLILFGARPYLRAPLSYDRDTIRELLHDAEIALAGEQTAIGDAIGLALKRVRGIESDSRVLVLLTDGANNEGRMGPRQAAEIARHLGVRIYTIGIGREQTPGPNPYGVWSADGAGRFEQELLEEIADLTGGIYFHVLDSEGLDAAYQQLDQLEPALGVEARDYLATPLYPWPLAMALSIAFWLFSMPLLHVVTHISVRKE